MVTEYPLTSKPDWRKWISFIKRAGAIAVVGSVITGGTVGGLFIRQQFSTPGILIPGVTGTANIWVDSSGGSCTRSSTPGNYQNNGTECSSFSAAYAISFPGDVVGFTGTLSTQQIISVSTTNGKPGASNVTFQFATGAKISTAVCGCIDMNGNSRITIDGGTDGTIQSTANGTNLANHSSATALSANPCTNCEVKNLTIGPVYTIASGDTFICASGCTVDNSGVRCILYSGSNWLIHNNTMHDASWCLFGQGNADNLRIYNNNIYNFDHGWFPGGATTPIYFYNNHLHDTAVWDNCNALGAPCHHDGIHCFAIPGPDHYPFVYIYNNLWDGAVGSAMTSWIYLESNSGSSCSDSTSKWYIFNNYFTSTDQVPTNPYVGSTTGSVVSPYYLYNNTFKGPGAGHFGGNLANCVYASKDFENDAVGGCSSLGTSGTGTTDFNAFADGTGTNCFPLGCTTGAFTSWQGTGKDTHSIYSPGSAVGSNTTGVGTNLTSLCTGDLTPLCTTRLGVTRPASGAWDAGSD